MLHLLGSESVVAPPMSYGGAVGRSWLVVRRIGPPSLKVLVAVPVAVLILGWWMAITLWGFATGLVATPSRLLRGGCNAPRTVRGGDRDLLAAIALAGKRS